MKKVKNIFVTALIGVTFASCSITYPYTATNNPIGSKKGTSESVMLFGRVAGTTLSAGLVLNKDYGVIEAARSAKIDKVATVDLKVTDFILFQKVQVIVTGE